MARIDADTVVTPEEVRTYLSRPSDFGWFGREEMFKTWALGPVIEHRDSTILEQSNAATVVALLESDKSLKGQWEVVECGHWAVGWAKHLSFRALDKHGRPTRAFRVILKWFKDLRDCPVANEDDYSTRQIDASVESMEQAAKSLNLDESKVKGVRDWAYQILRWLWDNEEHLDQDDEGLDAPKDEQIKRAIVALGWAQ